MRGTVLLLLSTPQWHCAQLKKAEGELYLKHFCENNTMEIYNSLNYIHKQNLPDCRCITLCNI